MSCYICGGNDNGIVLDYSYRDCKICKTCNGHKNVLLKTKGAPTYDTANSVEYFSNILKRRNIDSEIRGILSQWNAEIDTCLSNQIEGDEEVTGMLNIQYTGGINNKEIEYLLREELSTLKSIKSMLKFFVILTVIGLVSGIIIALSI